MLLSEAVAELKLGLGNIRPNTPDTVFVTALKTAQRQAEYPGTTNFPWFLETDASLSFLAGATSAPLPADFIIERQMPRKESPLLQLDAEGFPVAYVEKVDLQDLEADTLGVAAGSSHSYALYGSTLRIGPPPATPTTFRLYYYRADTPLAELPNLWLTHAPDLLIGRAGMQLAQDMEYSSAVTKFSARYSAAYQALVAAGNSRRYEGRVMEYGDAF